MTTIHTIMKMASLKSTLAIVLLSLIGGLTGCQEFYEYMEPKKPHPQETTDWLIEDEATALGVNFNGQFDFIDYTNLERTQTTWVRGFVDYFQFYEDPKKLKEDVRLQKYLTLKDNGYQTILNIKWDFRTRDMSLPDSTSQEMKDYGKFLKKLLDEVWDETDIIVVGNEPFIETKIEERDERLVAFYQQIARMVHRYRQVRSRSDGRSVPIFLGAINNLHVPRLRTTAVVQLLDFVERTPWVAGVDLHQHHPAIEQLNEAMDYVDDKIRDNQKILLTEFSLMRHFKSKMQETIPEVFAEQYGYHPGMQNFQYIDLALKNPVSRLEWVDFLSKSYWFENRKFYLRNAHQRLSSYPKFYAATYAFRQSFPFHRDFTVTTDPWVLNGLYANRTVVLNPTTGLDQFNYAFINDFRAIQNNEF